MRATTVSPYLIVDGGHEAIDWYVEVFGAEEVSRATGIAGRVAHAELRSVRRPSSSVTSTRASRTSLRRLVSAARRSDPFGHIWLITAVDGR